MKVDPVFVVQIGSDKVRQLESVTLELVNLTVPARAIHIANVNVLFRPRVFPLIRTRHPLGRLSSYYQSGPDFLAADSKGKFTVSKNRYIECRRQLSERVPWWQQFELVDEHGNRHLSRRLKVTADTFVLPSAGEDPAPA